MSDLDLSGLLPALLPQGAGKAADSSLITTGTVYAVNLTTHTVQVGVRGIAVWLPALPGRYVVSGTARVLMDTAAGRPVLVLAPNVPEAPMVLATVSAVAGTTVTVSWPTGSVALPAVPSTYTVGSRAWVATDDWGVPVMIVGPSTLAAAAPPAAPTPPAPPSATRQDTVMIGPQWSGTYRHNRGAWDRWNTDRYGGRSTLYQGDGFGSGHLTGLAVYGDQLVNLGAISIDQVLVVARGVGLSGTTGSIVMLGSPHGSPPGGAPTGVGTSFTASGPTAVPSDIREGMRTGSVKGLATDGAGYNACAGAGNGDGMVLQVTYTRSA